MKDEEVLERFSYMMVSNPYEVKYEADVSIGGVKGEYPKVMKCLKSIEKIEDAIDRVPRKRAQLRMRLSLAKYYYDDQSDKDKCAKILEKILSDLRKELGSGENVDESYFTRVFERMKRTEAAAKVFLGLSNEAVEVRKKIWYANLSSLHSDRNEVYYWMFWKNPTKERESPVMIIGETGTGKELVAAAIGYGTCTSWDEYRELNFGALSPQLASSELFGHVSGAFTGANRNKTGYLEQCEKGSAIFLDELPKAPSEVKTQLLRVMPEGEFHMVGSTELLRTEARFIGS
jgi:transcriptional regulator of acetoin/glycerol metabolism